jgi:ATPase family AAA domain-containing protein 1
MSGILRFLFDLDSPSSDGSQSRQSNMAQFVSIGSQVAIALIFSYSLLKLTDSLHEMVGVATDQGGREHKEAMLKEASKKLNRPDLERMDLSTYEIKMLGEVISNEELGVSFTDIGGMPEEIDEVRDNVVLPMKMWSECGPGNVSDIISCPQGVLLYGKPGTGKTMTAKAIAKECSATFISVNAANVMDKFLGESEKLVSGLFSLARKIAPCIIFIDEMDTMLRSRDSAGPGTPQAQQSMLGMLLAEWDGLRSNDKNNLSAPVMLLGATNRPMDLDNAILRRMSVQIKTRMPDESSRLDILKKLLAKENVDWKGEVIDQSLQNGKEDGHSSSNDGIEKAEQGLDLDLVKALAKHTADYSGSDLKELVRLAMLQRAKRIMVITNKEQAILDTQQREQLALNGNDKDQEIPAYSRLKAYPKKIPLSAGDFEHALRKSRKTGDRAVEFTSEMLAEQRQRNLDIFNKALDTLKEDTTLPVQQID